MSGTESQTRADLVHKPDDGRRPPIAVGNWVTFYPPDHWYASKLGLFMVLDGPRYDKQDGRCVDELWTCDDGRERSRYHLTPIDLAELTHEANAAAACVIAGLAAITTELDALALRARRAAELARGHHGSVAPVVGRSIELVKTIEASERLDAAIAARTRLLHIALPNVARNLYQAGALALAEQAGASGWVSNAAGRAVSRWKDER